MSLRPSSVLHLLGLAGLRCASVLAPARARAEWWREWRAELWHAREARTPARGISWSGELEVAKFCMGAFQDARCLRADSAENQSEEQPVAKPAAVGSAAQCILALMAVAAASWAVAMWMPGVSTALQTAEYRTPQNLMMIQAGDYSLDSSPSISRLQYETWWARRQQIFDDFAFYQVRAERGLGGNSQASRVAVASGNLFRMLGLPVRFADAEVRADLPRLILSDETWKRNFAGDPNVAGRVVELSSGTAVVVGVAMQGAWRLPGKVDGWLLMPHASDIPDRLGFVVAHLKSTTDHAQWRENWSMSAPQPDGKMGDFTCLSLTEETRGPKDLFLFAVFLACLALPATTSIPLGEYRVSSQKQPWSKRLRRWGFLACKIALLLPIVYFASLDLAHLRSWVDPYTSIYIQLVASFSVCLFGLRWVLRDQRQRCPVCLKKLTHPARVGQPSRSFLAWNGTELICLGGHGLLHIPEVQTSWFNTQRWLYLDPSWDVLFTTPAIYF